MAAEPIKRTRTPSHPIAFHPGSRSMACSTYQGTQQLASQANWWVSGILMPRPKPLESLQRTLQAGGSDLSKVIKVTIYLTDMTHFEKIVALREQWFTAPYPADTIVEVKALALPELMIEIEAIAVES